MAGKALRERFNLNLDDNRILSPVEFVEVRCLLNAVFADSQGLQNGVTVFHEFLGTTGSRCTSGGAN
ncbi:hypothetical protein AB5J72_47395 [Streptomyces sp. CG1]|uniref:hypothetical protein n=1 Tax=Streptomyces sp. CG1 TaxID=1287523 RepID=UPI0034E2F6F4